MITIGADPEVFIEFNNKVVPICGILGGTKKENLIVEQGIGLLEDNVLGEYTIPPCKEEKEFIYFNNKALELMLSYLPSEHAVVVKASNSFSKEELKKAGSKAFEFGCSTDYNAINGRPNRKPSPYTTLRTAGGHVHIGFDFNSDKERVSLVKVCDYILGLSSVIEDTDNERKSLYGKAGCYRLKPYGIEYRVLSNYWLKSDELKGKIFKRSILSARSIDKLPELEKIIAYVDVQKIINTNDKEKASNILLTINKEVFNNELV